ncbi:MAG TPA: hypothetical protein VKS20_09010, partial [Candidatus Acidoferrales bacterium]|nr:hypothetical protein [Candidatus Acidoferrales bacterium]
AAGRRGKSGGKAAARKTNGRFSSALGNPADTAGFPLSHRFGGGPSSRLRATPKRRTNHLLINADILIC